MRSLSSDAPHAFKNSDNRHSRLARRVGRITRVHRPRCRCSRPGLVCRTGRDVGLIATGEALATTLFPSFATADTRAIVLQLFVRRGAHPRESRRLHVQKNRIVRTGQTIKWRAHQRYKLEGIRSRV